MTSKGKRLDLLLEELGYCSSRQIARTAIMDGSVIVNGNKVTKPGTLIKDGAKIEFCNNWKNQPKYVSRGGLKLEKALEEFKVCPKNRVCLDIGASTGGFTDCLLKFGAAFVYSIDVGYGQIAWSLRTDKRVRVIERTNARNLVPEILYGIEQPDGPGSEGLAELESKSESEFESGSGSESESESEPEPESRLPNKKRLADLAVLDVSFISLSKVLPAVKNCLADPFEIVALVKPQFEAGPEKVGKGGVIRSRDVHIEVLTEVIAKLEALGLFPQALSYSPLKGPQGNIEFLLHLKSNESQLDEGKIIQVVDEASLLK